MLQLVNKVTLLLMALVLVNAAVIAYGRQSEPKEPVSSQFFKIKDFCRNLDAAIGKSLTQLTSNSIRINQIAQAVIDHLKEQTLSEYLAIKKINYDDGNYTSFKPEKYLSLATLLQSALSLSKTPRLIFDIDELKYIPYMQQFSEILLITHSLEPLNEQRVRAVIAMAKRLSVQVSIIWIGPTTVDKIQYKDYSTLHDLVLHTKGTLLDLGGSQNPCFDQI